MVEIAGVGGTGSGFVGGRGGDRSGGGLVGSRIGCRRSGIGMGSLGVRGLGVVVGFGKPVGELVIAGLVGDGSCCFLDEWTAGSQWYQG